MIPLTFIHKIDHFRLFRCQNLRKCVVDTRRANAIWASCKNEVDISYLFSMFLSLDIVITF